MSTIKDQVLDSLRDPEYRKLFRADALRTRLALKLREMRLDRGLTQKALGVLVGKPQAVVSRLENPDYGRFSLATLEELADAFDVHLYVDFVRFSRLAEWMDSGYPEEMVAPGFWQDYERIRHPHAVSVPSASLRTTSYPPTVTVSEPLAEVHDQRPG